MAYKDLVLADGAVTYWDLDTYQRSVNKTPAAAYPIVKGTGPWTWIHAFSNSPSTEWGVDAPRYYVTAWFKITPVATGSYTFMDSGIDNTFGYLYDADPASNSYFLTDDNSGPGNGFQITATLTGGQTYWLAAAFYDTSASNYGRMEITVTGGATSGTDTCVQGYRDAGAKNLWATQRLEPTGTWAPPASVSGRATGNAMSLSGQAWDGLWCGSSAAIGTGWTGLTVEAWIKTAGVSDSSIVSSMVQQGSDYANWRLGLDSTGHLLFDYYYATGYLDYVTAVSSGTVNDNAWHHVAATFDGSVVLLYVDAVQVASVSRTGSVLASTQGALWIGTSSITQTPMTGAIDDVSIYSTALSSTVLASHYNYVLPPVSVAPTGIVSGGIFGTAAVSGGVAYKNVVLADSPVAYWSLDTYEVPTNNVYTNAYPIVKNAGATWTWVHGFSADPVTTWGPAVRPEFAPYTTAWFTITPTVSASFYFEEMGVDNTYVQVFDSYPPDAPLDAETSGGPGNGYGLNIFLTGGQTYWVASGFWSETEEVSGWMHINVTGGATTGDASLCKGGFRDEVSSWWAASINESVARATTTGRFGGGAFSASGLTGEGLLVGPANMFGVGGTRLTLEAWAKIPVTTTAGYLVTNSGTTPTTNNWLLRTDATGKFIFDFYAGPSTLSTVTSPLSYNDNAWHHVVGVYDGFNVLLYVDGVVVATAARVAATVQSISAAKVYIGGTITQASTLAVDDVAVYTTALLPRQVTAHYTNSPLASVSKYEAAVLADNPIMYLPMQETSGTTAIDFTGFGRSATYVNGAVVSDATDASGPPTGSGHVRLDGTDDHVLLEPSTWFTPAGVGFTFECWVLVRSWSNWARIFDFANTASIDDMFFGANSTAGMALKIAGSTVTWSSRPSVGVWHQLVVTVASAGSAVIYMDGAQVQTGSVSAPTSAARQYKYLGRSSAPIDPYLAASFAHVSMYNGVLTSAKVKAHYDAATIKTYGGGFLVEADITSAPARQVGMSNPNGVVVGDLLLNHLFYRSGGFGGATLPASPPAGWTLVAGPYFGGYATSVVYAKYAEAGDPSTWLWVLPDDDPANWKGGGRIIAVPGGTVVGPVNYVATTADSGTTATTNPVSVSAGASVLVVAAEGLGPVDFSVPALTMTELTDGARLAHYWGQGLTSGTYDPPNVTTSASMTGGYVTITLAVVPAVVPAGISTGAAFGTPVVSGAPIMPAGIASAEVFSVPLIPVTLVYTLLLTRTRLLTVTGEERISSVPLGRTRGVAAVPQVDLVNMLTFSRDRTISLSGSGAPGTNGDLLAFPIQVTHDESYSLNLTQFTLTSGETISGVASAWFKVSPSAGSGVSITSSSANAWLRPYVSSVSNPTFADLAPISGSALNLDLTFTGSPIYVLVDILSAFGSVIIEFDIDEISLSYITIHSFVESVPYLPAAVALEVTTTSDISVFDILFDGVEVLGDVPVGAGNMWSGTVALPEGAAGLHTITVDGGTATASTSLMVNTEPPPPEEQGDEDPARLPAEAVGRWSLQDRVADEMYIFPLNPVQAGSYSFPRNHTVESTTKPTSFVVFQGASDAKQFEFSGVLLDQDMYLNLLAWSRLNRRVYLVDHNATAYQIAIEEFDVKPRTNPYNPWLQDYVMRVRLLRGPYLAEEI